MTEYSARDNNRARRLFLGLLQGLEPAAARFVWIANFEAEKFWAPANAVQLPRLSPVGDSAIVNCLEEMILFLAEDPDTVILRKAPDPGFLDYIRSLGFRPPTVLAIDPGDSATPISQAMLAADNACDSLAKLATAGNHVLVPFAKTRLEEEIARRTGLGQIAPTASVCESVNSKIYSRRMASELELKQVPGRECESAEELAQAAKALSSYLASGRLVLKESMGVSGKGLLVIEDQARLDRTVDMLRRRSKPGAPFGFVLEKWIDKEMDINYQIFISASGEVSLLAIKEIAAENGVHMGHRFPPALTPTQQDVFQHAAQVIGKRLHRDGYAGIAGIDAMVDREGLVYPLLEINARLNMSSFHLNLEEVFEPGYSAIAKYYALELNEPVRFDELKTVLESELFMPGRNPHGAVILNFAAVNVNCEQGGKAAKGRLYVLISGETPEDVRLRDRRIAGLLMDAGWLAGSAAQKNDKQEVVCVGN